MRKTLSAAIISSFLFAACDNSGSSSNNISFDSSIVTNTKPVTQISDSSTVALPVQPVQNTLQTVPATTVAPVTTVSSNPATATTAATAPGMNPPHGQPGHRCDISVGAPLNSAPAKTTAAPVVTSTATPIATPATITPAAVKTAPGMNPPHGQPGHRCDIAVGAPLNSAPAKAAATTKPVAETKTADAIPAVISLDSTRK